MPELTTTLHKLIEILTTSPHEIHSEEFFLFYIFAQALNLLDLTMTATAAADSNAVLKVKQFLRFLSSVISDQNRLLTCQTVQDLQSEYFRLYLRLQCLVTRGSLVKKDLLTLADIESYLESSAQVTRSDFQSHMKALTSCKNVITLDSPEIGYDDMNYASVLADMEKYYPKNQKGQWYRCKKGHYFCPPPSVLDNITPECPECKGED